MFNSENDKTRMLVNIALTGERSLKGNLLVVPSSTVLRTLNNDSQFLEFEELDGSMHLIAKSSICEVVPVVLPRDARLDSKPVDNQNTPHKALGLNADASAEEVEAAFASLNQIYATGNFTASVLPEEVSRYLEAKRSHLAAAYGFLTGKRLPAAA